jgi:hypothetical protein
VRHRNFCARFAQQAKPQACWEQLQGAPVHVRFWREWVGVGLRSREGCFCGQTSQPLNPIRLCRAKRINLRPQLKSAISKQKKDDDKSKTRKNEDNQKIKELKKSKKLFKKIKDSKIKSLKIQI